MGWSLPYLAAAVAVLAAFGPGGAVSRRPSDYLGALVGLLGLGWAFAGPVAPGVGWGLAAALPLGLAAARGVRHAAPVALASAAMAAAWAVPPARDAWLIEAAAVSVGALALVALGWTSDRGRAVYLAGAAALPAVALASGFGFAGPGFRPAHAAVVLALVGAVLAFVGSPRGEGEGDRRPFAAAGLFVVGLGLALAWFQSEAAAYGLAAGVLALAAAATLDLRRPGGILLAATVAALAAGLAFNLGKGYAVSVAAMAATLGALVMGRPALLTALAPLAGLAWLRGWREMHPFVTRFFDVSQAYGALGLVLGALAAAALVEWARAYQLRCLAARFAGLLVGAAAVGAAVVVPVVLNAEGLLGFVIGTALGAAFVRPGASASAAAAGWAGGALGLAAVLVDPLFPQTMLTRSEKIAWLAGPAAGIALALVGAAVLAARSRPLTESEVSA